MEREKLTRILLRILRVVDEGGFPAPVREVFVFGSYARGALDPGDLDLILVHGPRGEDDTARVRAELAAKNLGWEQFRREASRFRSDMLRTLRKPGEKVDYLLTENLESVVGPGRPIGRPDVVRLWSLSDRGFESKVRAISVDPDAGRAPRNHFASLKRFADTLDVMERAMTMLEDGRLLLTRHPVDSVNIEVLNPHHASWLSHWRQCGVMGRGTLELLPLGMWWIQSHRQKSRCPHQTEMFSESMTHRVHFGRPSIGMMVSTFVAMPKVPRQCLIPRLRQDDPNELLTFERGPNWTSRNYGSVLPL